MTSTDLPAATPTKRRKPKHYYAVDSKGRKFTRSSRRNYTHCVVRHIAARMSGFHQLPPYSCAEWAGSLKLAERAARQFEHRPHIVSVEILPAQQEGAFRWDSSEHHEPPSVKWEDA